ncbi:Helix-turn-helix domain-containing protein [Streptomyces sp. WMMB 714]|uniref:winged helix-turn-helix domain-containing protein n=1 Tax=Streptomyces sp. WMMB 714 TaxID=1286822 RepID=UPI0005F86511|nr:winged helix-turn-helix domain-containing protein [Streptomyces sp. WMMB 714]SCK21011.1 Helix-turn-helix domain-containing protein [Streptomyces sp. WMMB 714]
MLRLHFTVEDLLLVSTAEEPSPLLETCLAFMMLRRADPRAGLGRWQQRHRASLPRHVRALRELLSDSGAGPHFLDPPGFGIEDGVERIMSTPRETARSELRRMCAVDRPVTSWLRRLADKEQTAWEELAEAVRGAHDHLVTPAWPRLEAGFRTEIAWRSRRLVHQGLRETLTGLAPGLRWRGATLEADYPREVEVHLGGRGLVLQPSLFWTGRPLVACHEGQPTVLVYPALTPVPLLDAPTGRDHLAALLGSTRAAVLRLLTRQFTTTEAARELGISTASASTHAKALREAGLVTSLRDGKAVLHWCTPLGLDLVAHSASQL